jgi:hypothetical protein
MKEFMMIFIGADYAELGLSPEQLQEQFGKWFAWGDKMQKQGILKGGEALTPVGKRISGPDRVESDGPFVESKELVGGYYTVTAESYDDVVKIAQDYPDFDFGGTVEIREIMKFDK